MSASLVFPLLSNSNLLICLISPLLRLNFLLPSLWPILCDLLIRAICLILQLVKAKSHLRPLFSLFNSLFICLFIPCAVLFNVQWFSIPHLLSQCSSCYSFFSTCHCFPYVLSSLLNPVPGLLLSP